MFSDKEHFENHCQFLKNYFYKYNTKILLNRHEQRGHKLRNMHEKDIYIVQDVIKLNDDEKDRKFKKDGSIITTLFGSHSRRFKAKISMFKQANSYENLYLIDKTVKDHQQVLEKVKRDVEMQKKVSELAHPQFKVQQELIRDLMGQNQ